MPAQSRIQGLDGLAAALKGLSDPKEIGKTLRRGCRSFMTETKKAAQQLIPVGVDEHQTIKGRLVAPGFAKRNIDFRVKVDKSGLKATAVLGVKSEAYYAVQFVEIGTSKMGAQPWLRPAFRASSDPGIRQLADGIDDWIIGVAKGHANQGNSARSQQLLSTVQT